MKKTLFLLLLLSLLLTASGCRRRITTAAPIPQSVADAQPLGDDSPSRAAPQTSSPDADPDSETVENPDSPRREYDENAAAASTSRRIIRSMATARAAVSRFQAAKRGRPPRSLTTKPPCPSP